MELAPYMINILNAINDDFSTEKIDIKVIDDKLSIIIFTTEENEMRNGKGGRVIRKIEVKTGIIDEKFIEYTKPSPVSYDG